MVSFEEFCDYMKPSNSVETYITKTIKKLFNNYSITTINIDVCCEYVDDRVAPARLRRIKTWLQSNSIFKNVDIKHEYVMAAAHPAAILFWAAGPCGNNGRLLWPGSPDRPGLPVPPASDCCPR